MLMGKLTVVKFGGSAIGVDGYSIPTIIKRIDKLKENGKVIAVFSAPLTMSNNKKISINYIGLFFFLFMLTPPSAPKSMMDDGLPINAISIIISNELLAMK